MPPPQLRRRPRSPVSRLPRHLLMHCNERTNNERNRRRKENNSAPNLNLNDVRTRLYSVASMLHTCRSRELLTKKAERRRTFLARLFVQTRRRLFWRSCGQDKKSHGRLVGWLVGKLLANDMRSDDTERFILPSIHRRGTGPTDRCLR